MSYLQINNNMIHCGDFICLDNLYSVYVIKLDDTKAHFFYIYCANIHMTVAVSMTHKLFVFSDNQGDFIYRISDFRNNLVKWLNDKHSKVKSINNWIYLCIAYDIVNDNKLFDDVYDAMPNYNDGKPVHNYFDLDLNGKSLFYGGSV